MDDQWIYPSGSQASAADQLDALQRAQDALWVKLRREDDPEQRMGLLAEFGENRDAIERLTKSVAAGTAIDDGSSDAARSGEPDEPAWSVDQEDEQPTSVKPLSFSDTGELVAHEVSGSSSAELPEMVDPSALDEPTESDEAPTPAEEDIASGDDLEAGWAAPSIFGSAELADGPLEDLLRSGNGLESHASSVNGGSNGLSDGLAPHTPTRDPAVQETAAPDTAAHEAAGLDAVAQETPAEAASQDIAEQLGGGLDGPRHAPIEVADTDPASDRGRGRTMDQYGEPAEEDLAAYFLAEDSRSDDNGSYSEGFESIEPPDYQQPLPGLGRSGPSPYASPADSDPAALRAQASSRAPAPTSQYPAIRPPRQPVRQGSTAESETESPRRALMLLGGLVAVLGISWALLSGPGGDAPTSAASEPTGSTSAGEEVAAPSADAEVDEIMIGLTNMGLPTVGAERRGSVIFLTGVVPTAADRDIAIRVAQGVAPEQPVDASELVTGQPTSQAGASAPDGRAATFQTELNRIVAATPIIFQVEQTSITDLHARILNSVASVMRSYPDIQVTIVGYTDNTGSDENNRAISLSRAESVKAYLVSQGLPEGSFALDARGEEVATGSQALANLERRVEFEVNQPEGEAAAAGAPPLRIAIVAPSARNDLAFTQSMVDAVNVIVGERGNVDVAITDSTFVPDEASDAIRGYAAEGYDLVIAHGSQFGTALVEIAPEYPDVTFAWGTASDTFGQPNVYAYDAAAHQGGYVMGTMSTLLSTSGVVGVIGPIEVGDARLYVNGFRSGALASKPDATVLVDYTGSFSDLTLAAETAQAQASKGADVMTGSAQMVVGAVSVASETGTYWFGTQANQTSLAPSLVVASQVYHWEVILRRIIGDIDGGSPRGQTYTADLANGGLVIEYNPDVVLPEAVRARADQVTAAIVDGSLQVPTG